MKHLYKLLFTLLCTVIYSKTIAQQQIASVNTQYITNFNGFMASGFQPSPAAGELSSNTWSVTGMSDGNLLFGGTMNMPNTDFTRGVNNGGAGTGGLYAFDINGDTTMGVQPVAADFTPGDFIFKVQNTTGVTITSLYVSYELWINNDQDRSGLLNFSHSNDNLTYTPEASLSDTSDVLADTLFWQLNNKKILLSGLNIPNNGFYYLKWTGNDVAGAGSRDEFAIDDITVIANPLPITARFGIVTDTVCLGQQSCFIDSSFSLLGNINSWTWSFGDGGTSAQQNPCYTYLSAGTYSVKLVVNDDLANKDSITYTMVVNPLPIAAFSATTECLGAVTVFTDMSSVNGGGNTIATWDWDFGDNSPHSNAQNPTHTYQSTGVYAVTLCVGTNNGCTACITTSVTVNPNPIAAFSYTSNGCASTIINFQDASQAGGNINIISRAWDFGDGNTSAQQNPSHTYLTPGTYTVSLIVVNAFGCSDTVFQQVPVGGVLPVAQIATADTCFGAAMMFVDQSTIAAGSIVAWQWDFGDGNSAITQNAQNTYANAGQYNVRLIVTSNVGCLDTTYQVVVVAPAVQANYTSSINGLTVNFTSNITGGVPAYTYDWDFGDGSPHSFLQNPSHIYNAPNPAYIACLIGYDSFGCSDTICIQVFPNSILSRTEEQVVFVSPNPSPGVFFVELKNAITSFQIRNIFGEVVYESKGLHSAGKFKIDILQQPIGIYFLTINSSNGDYQKTIKLIKEK